jgi:hypothetical protein
MNSSINSNNNSINFYPNLINSNFHDSYNSYNYLISNSNSNSFIKGLNNQDEFLTKIILFDSIKSYDFFTFAKCLHNSNADIFEYKDEKNMNGK